MTMNHSAADEMSSEINVTPMIDVLLVLLIIFMLIVPATSAGETALTPKPARNDTPGHAVVLEVLSGRSGEAGFRINEQDVAREDLRTRLEAIYANRSDRTLFVKADDELAFTQVANAIDIAHAAGVDRVGLLTPRVEAGL